ncbi:MAG: RNA polymerase sigma factor [Sandaracinaceae bacterium]
MAQPLPDTRALFEAHCDYVYRVVRYFGAAPGDVEDLVQEVFMTALRARDRFRGDASPRTWLVGIARNHVRDYKKRAHRRYERADEDADARPAEGGDPERSLELKQALAQLDRVLDGLGREQRLVFLLHDVEQLTMKEVTDGLGCPLQTGYTRLRAARRHVRERAIELEMERR